MAGSRRVAPRRQEGWQNVVSVQIHGWKLLFSLNVVGSKIRVAGVVDVHEDLVHPPGDVGDDQADEEQEARLRDKECQPLHALGLRCLVKV